MSLIYESLGNCPDCAEHPDGICDTCLASLRETDAGLDEADGRAGK